MSKQSRAARGAPRRTRKPLAAAAVALAAAAGGWAVLPATVAEAAPVAVTVYKSPTCGCCGKWIEHMEENGFVVTAIDTDRVNQIKDREGVPALLSSCHTSLVDGYAVEGHVPADVVRKLLAERPEVDGLGVRGMPAGSPGMEQGGKKEPYAVFSFDDHGRTAVFARK